MKENVSIGTKESEGKLMTTELDSRFTKEMAKVMTINKAKYPRGNKYKKLDPIELKSISVTKNGQLLQLFTFISIF